MGFQNLLKLAPNTAIWLELHSGTHSVYVCTIHENAKLMMFEMRLSDLPTYHHCLARIVCNPPLPKCYLGGCDSCPSVTRLEESPIALLEENNIDQIVQTMDFD